MKRCSCVDQLARLREHCASGLGQMQFLAAANFLLLVKLTFEPLMNECQLSAPERTFIGQCFRFAPEADIIASQFFFISSVNSIAAAAAKGIANGMGSTRAMG